MTTENGGLDTGELAALPPEERARVWQAAHGTSWSRGNPVNLRFSVPLFSQRYFVTIVAGRERRSGDRRCRDRRLNPLLTPGNLFFMLVLVLIGAAAAFFLLAGLRVMTGQ